MTHDLHERAWDPGMIPSCYYFSTALYLSLERGPPCSRVFVVARSVSPKKSRRFGRPSNPFKRTLANFGASASGWTPIRRGLMIAW
jgi:hypothetical protein